MSCNDKIIIEITELNTNVNLEIVETCEVVVLEIQDVGIKGDKGDKGEVLWQASNW
jgi:hypothetical protein